MRLNAQGVSFEFEWISSLLLFSSPSRLSQAAKVGSRGCVFLFVDRLVSALVSSSAPKEARCNGSESEGEAAACQNQAKPLRLENRISVEKERI